MLWLDRSFLAARGLVLGCKFSRIGSVEGGEG